MHISWLMHCSCRPGSGVNNVCLKRQNPRHCVLSICSRSSGPPGMQWRLEGSSERSRKRHLDPRSHLCFARRRLIQILPPESRHWKTSKYSGRRTFPNALCCYHHSSRSPIAKITSPLFKSSIHACSTPTNFPLQVQRSSRHLLQFLQTRPYASSVLLPPCS